MAAYYNEFDPYAAQWLRNLIAAGLIAPGDVDERDIRDVRPDDITGYTQCHFFAGLGGWSYALRLAGWPDNRPAWTGSCPCQPWSESGKRLGENDERHLWPDWFRLILENTPLPIFGEQVASKGGLAWLDIVQSDLENAGYKVGAVDMCAAGVGAPHMRQRLYFVAYSAGLPSTRDEQEPRERGNAGTGNPAEHSGAGGLGDAGGERLAIGPRPEDRPGTVRNEGPAIASPSFVNGFWTGAEWIKCTDGKIRPIEPGTSPLAYGIPKRVGRLRAYGNAIVPQVAAEFVRAYMEIAP